MLSYIALLCAAWVTWKIVCFAAAPKSQIDNLPGPASPSWIIGHLLKLYDKQGWGFHRELLNYGPVFKLQGMLGQPVLCVYDPAAMHSIVIKDEHIFEEMRFFINMSLDIFGPGLISSIGEAHRKQRKLMNPVFSGSNLQHSTPVLYEVVHRLTDGIRALVMYGAAEVDLGSYMGRTALELIGQAAIGHSFDPLTETRLHPCAEALKGLVPAVSSLSSYFQVYSVIRRLIPRPLRRPLMDLLPSRRIKGLLRNVDVIEAHVLDIYTEKKREIEAASQQGGASTDRAKDLMSMFLDVNNRASAEDTLSQEELIAQLSTVLFAATDTTSNALTRVFDCLVKRPDVQAELRGEIMAAKREHGYGPGDLPYDKLLALPYLDAVYRETLRVYPPAPLRFREARADIILPLSKPVRGTDGTLMHSIFVPEGTLVFLPVRAANTSLALWGTNAAEWRPERWLAPLPASLTEAKIPGVYSHLMSFWGGGRACIGFKFAELEMKIVLAELLSTFRFEGTGKPVVWNMGEIIYSTVGQDSITPAFPMKVTAL